VLIAEGRQEGTKPSRPRAKTPSFVLLPREMAMMTFVNLPVTVVAHTRMRLDALGKR
jgi:hypothetical protein